MACTLSAAFEQFWDTCHNCHYQYLTQVSPGMLPGDNFHLVVPLKASTIESQLLLGEHCIRRNGQTPNSHIEWQDRSYTGKPLLIGDVHSRVSDGVALLCSTASAAQHSSPRLGDRLSVACYCFSSQPAGLR